MTESQIPKCRARNDSSGVRAIRRSFALDTSAKNNNSRGKMVKHEDSKSSSVADAQVHRTSVLSIPPESALVSLRISGCWLDRCRERSERSSISMAFSLAMRRGQRKVAAAFCSVCLLIWQVTTYTSPIVISAATNIYNNGGNIAELHSITIDCRLGRCPMPLHSESLQHGQDSCQEERLMVVGRNQACVVEKMTVSDIHKVLELAHSQG